MTRIFTSTLKPLIVVLAMLAAPAPTLALDADEMFVDPTQEARARDIGRQLRCVKCRNQSIFDSNAGIAKDLRVVVRERMVMGDNDDEILAYVADRFGDYVLLKPRIVGQTYLLWAAPFLFLGIGGLAVRGYLRSRRASPTETTMTISDLNEAKRLLDGGTS